MRAKQVLNRIIKIIVTIALIAAMAISGYNALKMQNGYKAGDNVYQEMIAYKPVEEDIPADAPKEAFVNRKIVELKTDYPDALGWLTIPYTGIDYPFVQAEDNSKYLRMDIDGNYAIAGTIFMDCESSADFSDFNTILYGHHMKNGTMFGPLNSYGKRDFFETNKNGVVYLEDKTFAVEFFAYLVVKSNNLSAYDSPTDEASKIGYNNYIRENARYYRDIGASSDDQFITLSTCAYEFKDARMLLVGRLTKIQ